MLPKTVLCPNCGLSTVEPSEDNMHLCYHCGHDFLRHPPPDPAARLQVYERALQRIARYEPRFHHWQAQLLIEIAMEALAWKPK